MPDPAKRRVSSEYVWCALTIVGSIAWWFSPYLLRGYTFLSESGQMLWVDWVLARKVLFADGAISEWNPYVLFGVDWAGREAFLNPLNAGGLVGRLLPGDKFSFMGATMLFLALMGVSMYAFLRTLAIRPAFARIGTVLYVFAPKWADDGYHGPRFIVGYAILPLTLLLIVRMRAAGFRTRLHFVVFAVLVALTYLGLGAPFLVIQAYLVASFFGYMLYTCWRAQRHQDAMLLPRALGWLAAALVLFVGLSAYILLPFVQNYGFAERSLYSEQPGWSLPEYLGFVFPWINRIYGHGVYDLPYPTLIPIFFPNIYFYVGILAIPMLAIGFARRLWSPISLFFAVAFLVWLAVWDQYLKAVFPVIQWFERLTHGSGSQYQGHIILIASMSVVISSTLQAVVDRREEVWTGRAGRYLGWLNRALIAIYLSAAVTFVGGALVFGTGLKAYIWPHVAVGHYLFAHYYFQEALLTFLAIFLVRAAIVWLYHRRYLYSAAGQVCLLLLMVVDFQLVFRTWMPFTDMDARYDVGRMPNSFVLKGTNPLDRLGAAQYALVADAPAKALSAWIALPAPVDYAEVVRGFGALYYGGYKKPLFEPGFSYFPIAAQRSFYGYHESLMPGYFWDFDTTLNQHNAQYTRQSFIGVWDPHSPLLDVAGIRYLFWHQRVVDSRLTELGRYNNGSYVYENQRAVPRAYLVPRVEYFRSSGEEMNRLAEATFQPREAATTEDARLLEALKTWTGEAAPGDVRITAYAPNRVTVAVKAGTRSLLVLGDMYHPNWTVRINGLGDTIYRVDGLFRGVIVPQGQSTVEFRYSNRAFHVGLAVSAASWLAVGALFVVSVTRRA